MTWKSIFGGAASDGLPARRAKALERTRAGGHARRGTHPTARRRLRLGVAGVLVGAILVPAVSASPLATVSAAPVVGQGFTVTASDLSYILDQIKIAEHHAGLATAADPCAGLLGTGPNQVPSPLIGLGLRTVDGSCNNLQDGQAKFGTADQVFPRLTKADFRPAEPITAALPVGPPGPTSYAQSSGAVIDSQPRMISNLIVDQTSTNPAAVAAAGFPVRTQGNVGVVPCVIEDDPATTTVNESSPVGCVPAGETLFIPNVTTDVGLSPPYNSLFTIFGQFFDHGLDKITNDSGSGTVFVPLHDDDPLIAGPDGILGDPDPAAPDTSLDDPKPGDPMFVPPNARFMVLTRGKNFDGPGPDGVLGNADDTHHEAQNTDSPWVDLSQAYTSHPAHQVFLREYAMDANNHPQSTGRLLDSSDHSMANWGDVKTQARLKLGIALVDNDVNDIPMIAADPYGNFIPGPNGLPQFATASGLVEGNLASPVAVPANAFRVGAAFLNDIAHSAVPTAGGPDADTVAGKSLDTPVPAGTYDNELLDLHVIAGDGRANENIGLTAIHTIFEHEHNRLVGYEQNVLDDPANAALLQAYHDTSAGTFTYGERLFQAARFVTEMEYQHLVFEEFARKVQPAINPFNLFAFSSTNTNPAVKAEFAHAVYRFGHSMLDDDIARTNVDGTKNDIALLDGFLNPAAFKDVTAGDLAEAGGDMGGAGAGAIAMGLSDQVGNELDEFVSDTLRNNLLGLPLDLPALNMTRARSEGVPSLNNVRKQIFAETNDGQMAPYSSWVDFGLHLKHPESLINFVAAYGQHPTILAQTTLKGKRDAARAIVDPQLGDVQPPDAADFMFSTNYAGGTGPGPDGVLGTADDVTFAPASWKNAANGVSKTGLDLVDLWVGGLAEMTNLFGGLLGTTFNYVFELQLTQLQDGDRLYYLNRTPGMNLRAQLEGNSFSELIVRNTTATALKADAFGTADCKFELGHLSSPAPAGSTITGAGSVGDDPTTDCNENKLLIKLSTGRIQYRQINTVDPSGINGQSVYNGTNSVNLVGGGNDNDTFWGGVGNDVIEGNGGDDVALGGEGNDIITDLAGFDTLKGGPGNDALDGGIGDDLLLGGDGKDLTVGGANTNIHFDGPGDDFILAGQGADEVDGDSGDDWMEGGDQTDLLQGDSGSLFFDDHNNPGDDIMIGQNGDDDYDMEGGDDIGVAGPGIEKNAGAAGYDWSIGLVDPQPQNADLALPIAEVLPINQVRDRFNEVEALSGWNLNDTLRGDDVIPSAVTGGGFIGCDALDQDGLDRISGLDPLVPALTVPAAPVIAGSATNFCPLVGNVWGEGNILLGGTGTDVIEGRGADDIVDGDRYVNVRLSVIDPATGANGTTDLLEHAALNGTFGNGTDGMTLQAAVFAGLVDPGKISAVREIVTPTVPAADCGATAPVNCDTAVFSGPAANYTVTATPAAAAGPGDLGGTLTSVTVTDTVGTDGIDTLRNIENLRFCNATDPATRACLAFEDVLVSSLTLGPVALVSAGQPFAPTAVGTTSAVSTFTLTNTGILPLNIASAVLGGANAADFAIGTGSNCVGASLAPQDGCFIDVTFTPTTTGTKTATLTVTDNAPDSPQVFNLTATATPPDTTPPTVALTAPAAAATVSGAAVAVSANAADAVGVVGVRFLDGTTQIGAEDTTAPYAVSWNTTVGVANGAHTLTAVARDAAGNSTTSAARTVTVNNVVADTTPPTITARTPANGATGVAVANNLTATFSEAMNTATVNGTNITVRVGTATTGALVAAAVTYNATTRVVTINPNANLAADTRYTVRLVGVRDVAGNALGATPWSFLSGPAPTVSATTPAANATAIAVANNLTATFSEPMNATTVTAANITVRVGTTATGALVAGVVTYNATTRVATINPNANLAADTRYTVRLSAGLTDVAGNPLTATSWTFLTGPAPTVTARTPGINATAVSRTANQTATFSEAMNATTVVAANVTLRQGTAATGALIARAVTYNTTTRVVTINPAATLLANTQYTIRLTGLTDAAGNPLAATTWSFTTGA